MSAIIRNAYEMNGARPTNAKEYQRPGFRMLVLIPISSLWLCSFIQSCFMGLSRFGSVLAVQLSCGLYLYGFLCFGACHFR